MGIEMSLPGPIFKLQSTLLNDDKENGKKKVEEERGRESLEHSSSSSQETHFPGFVTTKKISCQRFFCPSLGFVAERSVALVKQSDPGLNPD